MKFRDRTNAILVTLLLTSIVVNVFLARKLSVLSQPPELATTTLQVGIIVPPLAGRTYSGQPVIYADSTLPTVLYVFTPQCIWCKKNLANLHALIDHSGGNYRVIGISLTTEGLLSYIHDNNLQLPIYADLDQASIAKYHLTGTPKTVIVSPESKVLKVWSGAYTNGIQQEVESYLKVKLPGCCVD